MVTAVCEGESAIESPWRKRMMMQSRCSSGSFVREASNISLVIPAMTIFSGPSEEESC